MSNYIIYGRECQFPGIPFHTLEEYGPKTYTHLFIWKATCHEDTLLIILWLRMLARLQAIDRLKIYDLERDKTAALFDYSGDSRLTAHMDILERYVGQICGTNYILRNPYRIAMHLEGEEMLKRAMSDGQFITDIYNANPHLREQVIGAAKLTEEYINICAGVCAATAGAHKETPEGRDGQRRLIS